MMRPAPAPATLYPQGAVATHQARPVRYRCPVHGLINGLFTVNGWTGNEGWIYNFCPRCLGENLMDLGVHQVYRMNPEINPPQTGQTQQEAPF